jgi:hypothetical protein
LEKKATPLPPSSRGGILKDGIWGKKKKRKMKKGKNWKEKGGKRKIKGKL